MEEALRNWHFSKWLDKADRGGLEDWGEIFSGYSVTVDFPACIYFKELMERYPNAVVLLTVRESEAWWKSFSSTLLHGYNTIRGCFWLKLLPPVRTLNRFQEEVVFAHFGADPITKETAISRFEAHNASVRELVPEEKLLEFNVKQGWEPLCEFLGHAIPDEPFPHLNNTKQFRKRVLLIRAINLLIGFFCIGTVLALAVLLVMWMF